ncbi:MADS-box transcription factor 1 [Spatholobus suberectus]|nr:MADS-box transcription factor 1 [Spatholobus suberectus]
MGRVKLKIKRLENTNGRLATYAKRKNGIMKKATELSILCDIDIILVMFSPSGKPSLCRGKHSSFEEVIIKFAQLTPQERAKRKLESLEVLKKTFKKLEHDVNIQDFLGTRYAVFIQDLYDQARLLQTHIYEIHKRLSYWTDLSKINSVEQLGQMENSLKESLNQIRSHKENIQKQQIASPQYNNQFNKMHVPFRMNAQQHLQPLSWITNGDNQNLVLPEDSNMLLHKDIEGSTSYSFGSYDSYLGSSTKIDISISKQESGVLNDLSNTSPMRLQVPYLPNNCDLLNEMKVQLTPEMKSHENHVDYHVNGGFEALRTEYDSNHKGWTSTSGPCAITMFDEHLYTQASFPPLHFGFT